MDSFELYFRQADADGDGRISGSEAVGFFRGSGLPQNVLAKIWQLADQAQRGFLAKPEFFFALKLVTVAQSGRELTPDIVRAVSAGSPSLQIPPPRIAAQVPVYRPPQPGPRTSYPGQQEGARPPPQQFQPNQQQQQQQQPWRPQVVGSVPPTAGLPGFGGSSFQATPPTAFQATRPPVTTSTLDLTPVPPSFQAPVAPPAAFQTPASFGPGTSSATAPATGFPTPGLQTPPTSGLQTAPATGFPTPGLQTPPTSGLQTAPASGLQTASTSGLQTAPRPGFQIAATPGFQTAATPGFQTAATPGFQTAATPGLQITPIPASSTSAVPITTALSVDLFGGDAFKATTSPPSNKPSGNIASSGNESAIVPVAPPAVSSQPVVRPFQTPALVPTVTWAKMSPLDVQHYTQVFQQVDTDRDGKIRGDQARDLFLSWQLPRDVLKQIWDLSDQDGDSMLSVQEFCIALYFMERYREGRPVPPVLPAGFLPEVATQPPSMRPTSPGVGPGGPVWSSPAGPGVPAGNENVGSMPLPAAAHNAGSKQAVQYKSRVPPLEVDLVNQLNRDDQSTLKSKYKEAEEADKKVFELDKDIADAREKIDFYRGKLQEIILYKTRSDNKLLEITERVASDKREVELLRRRYNLKFQQAGETNSRLLAEEAAFNDIQQRKMEIYNAIAKIDKGSGSKEALQERAEQISSDLIDLRNLLNQRAKKLGLRSKPTSAMELPFGWQPGIQENAGDWEDWDKFDNEGFVFFQKTGEDPVKESAPEENGQIESKPPSESTELSTEKPEKISESEEKPEEAATEKEEPIFKTATESDAESREKGSPTGDVPSWAGVFGDEDFGASTSSDKGSGLFGLKSIKTSDIRRGGDESVPETPVFKTTSVPETPLFKATSALEAPAPETPLFKGSPKKMDEQPQQEQRVMHGPGDESVPDTPLFKSEPTNNRNAFAVFDAFSAFDDAPGSSSSSASHFSQQQQQQQKQELDHWSTF